MQRFQIGDRVQVVGTPHEIEDDNMVLVGEVRELSPDTAYAIRFDGEEEDHKWYVDGELAFEDAAMRSMKYKTLGNGHRLIDIEAFRAAAKNNAPASDPVMRAVDAMPMPGEGRTIRFVFSDGSVDRAGDTIDPNGWDTAAFMRNPVALWAHASYEPPIGRASGLAIEGTRLMGDITFASADEYPFADTIYRLTKGGYINAVSVGFMPLEWSFVNDKDRPFGIDFKRQELMEISLCPVPCNANALAEARGKGIDCAPLIEWAEKVLDGGERIILPRAEVEAMRKSAGEGRTLYLIESDAELPPAAQTRIKQAFTRWIKARTESTVLPLILGPGLRLREIAAPPVDRIDLDVQERIDPSAVAEKAGRVLSAKNESDLRQCADLLNGVLAQVMPPEDEPMEEPTAPPMEPMEPMEEAAPIDIAKIRAKATALLLKMKRPQVAA